MKTFIAKKETVQRDWYLIDAKDKILGRMASRIAMILQGKTKPIYTPHVDTGDFVIVINAEKIKLTGNKMNDKVYYSHSGYPGGFKEHPVKIWLEKHPDRVINMAVKRMLPKTKLGYAMLKKLKIYSGPDHSHEAQQPKVLEI
ncbi:MAG: 50S ribosomal protein L13 [Planctomycetes bacterium GWA2_40_7]|nr:MAG: 50S ribosomal protein L13 [Planctomycetes bacterium GWA2_40_7]OHB48952.1 MAG: 50S ribosomal protein L13 [Planctomycetes bacterium GWF2_40_8]OHB90021.1 MAG: 50S ribosomal protein L13 [Planctomycetes bacterium RIFCSPHIGHO2_02_FULL_40_12]